MTNYENYRAEKISFYLEGIRNGTRTFPPSLQIALTDRCFNHCVMCDHWKREEKAVLDSGLLLKFLNQVLRTSSLQSVCYSGGDPMAYKDLDRVITWHCANDIPFGIITAGYVPRLFISMDILKYAEWIRVSLDAYDEEVYREVRGGVKVADVMKSICEMKASGCNVELGITLTKRNLMQLPKLAEFAINNGINRFRVWPVRHCEGYAIGEKEKREAAAVMVAVGGILSRKNIDNNLLESAEVLLEGELQDFPYCKAVLFQLFVTAIGDVMPCCILAGDSNDKSLWDGKIGTINNGCAHIMAEARKFSEIPRKSLPAACDGCTQRLQTINRYACMHWNDKLFV
jgi:MoaA/NifB/PqqE/SkfB family radical SAM enzyme